MLWGIQIFCSQARAEFFAAQLTVLIEDPSRSLPKGIPLLAGCLGSASNRPPLAFLKHQQFALAERRPRLVRREWARHDHCDLIVLASFLGKIQL